MIECVSCYFITHKSPLNLFQDNSMCTHYVVQALYDLVQWFSDFLVILQT